MKVALVALFVVSASACGGILSGFMKINGDPTNCNYVDIAQPSGIISRAVPFPPCSDVSNSSTGTPQTAFSSDEHAFFFMTGSGKSVWWVDDSTVEYKVWVNLPDSYDWTIGITPISSQGLYIITTSALYYVAEPATSTDTPVLTTLMNLTSLELDKTALLAGDFWNPYLYLVQGSTLYIFDFTVQTKPVISEIKLTLNSIIDLAVFDAENGGPINLVALQGTKLYLIDLSGVATLLNDIGTTPVSNSVGPDTFFYADNTMLSTLDLTTGKVLTTAPFDGKNLEGFFQYHP